MQRPLGMVSTLSTSYGVLLGGINIVYSLGSVQLGVGLVSLAHKG